MKAPILLLLFLFSICSFSAYSQSATVISENANLRGTPKQEGKVVEILSSGTQLQILKQAGVWFLVQTNDFAGWLHGNTIKLDETNAREATQIRSIQSSSSRISSSHSYIRGPRGGCYYINSNGKKTYVDRGLCN